MHECAALDRHPTPVGQEERPGRLTLRRHERVDPASVGEFHHELGQTTSNVYCLDPRATESGNACLNPAFAAKAADFDGAGPFDAPAPFDHDRRGTLRVGGSTEAAALGYPGQWSQLQEECGAVAPPSQRDGPAEERLHEFSEAGTGDRSLGRSGHSAYRWLGFSLVSLRLASAVHSEAGGTPFRLGAASPFVSLGATQC